MYGSNLLACKIVSVLAWVYEKCLSPEYREFGLRGHDLCHEYHSLVPIYGYLRYNELRYDINSDLHVPHDRRGNGRLSGNVGL